MKNMTDIDIILELEGGELVIEDYEDWNRVKELAYSLGCSQGSYGRMYRSMCDYETYAEEEYGEIPFPIYM